MSVKSRLAAAILLRAIKDVLKGDRWLPGASDFLRSEEAALLMDLLGLNRQRVLDECGLLPGSNVLWQVARNGNLKLRL